MAGKIYKCPKCNSPVEFGQPFCKACSTPIAWGGAKQTKKNDKAEDHRVQPGEKKLITKGYPWFKVLTILIPFVGIILGFWGCHSDDPKTVHKAALLKRLGFVYLAVWIVLIAIMAGSFIQGIASLRG